MQSKAIAIVAAKLEEAFATGGTEGVRRYVEDLPESDKPALLMLLGEAIIESDHVDKKEALELLRAMGIPTPYLQ